MCTRAPLPRSLLHQGSAPDRGGVASPRIPLALCSPAPARSRGGGSVSHGDSRFPVPEGGAPLRGSGDEARCLLCSERAREEVRRLPGPAQFTCRSAEEAETHRAVGGQSGYQPPGILRSHTETKGKHLKAAPGRPHTHTPTHVDSLRHQSNNRGRVECNRKRGPTTVHTLQSRGKTGTAPRGPPEQTL